MKTHVALRSAWLALSLAAGGCSSDPAPTATDAAADVSAVDTPSSTDTAPDAPRADANAADVTDVPSPQDVARTDAATDGAADVSDVTAPRDVSVTDVTVADVPATSDVPASTDGGAGDACVRPAIMRLTGMIDCSPRGGGPTACPMGYECLSHSGVVLQQLCGRSCTSDCDCPSGEVCGSYTDKAGRHPLCVGAM